MDSSIKVYLLEQSKHTAAHERAHNYQTGQDPNLLDHEFNQACMAITGYLKPTNVENL